MIKDNDGDQIAIDYWTKKVDTYTQSQMLTMRIIAIVSSVLSLAFGLLFFYLYACMRKRHFRHHLILLLIGSDFLKAFVLLWFPAQLVRTRSTTASRAFCAVVGFFTTACIQLSDFAVFSLAVHFALLMFSNHKKQSHLSSSTSSSSGLTEGLYPYRKIVYPLVAIVPFCMAGLAFIHDGANTYQPYVTWCYIPVNPLWFRMVFTWVWRFIIFIVIMAIYIGIYIYVKVEYRKVSNIYPEKFEKESGFKYRINRFFGIILPCINTTTPINAYGPRTRHDSQTDAVHQFQKEQLNRFIRRRSMIERQIKSLFIYPAAYIILWAAPFVHQCVQLKYEMDHHPVFWLGVTTAFMQPFNCVVDTIVFCFRERPWRDRKERVFTLYYIKKLFNYPEQRRQQYKEHQQQQIGSQQLPLQPFTFTECYDPSTSKRQASQASYDSKIDPKSKVGSNNNNNNNNISSSSNNSFSTIKQPEPACFDPFSLTTARRVDAFDVEKSSDGTGSTGGETFYNYDSNDNNDDVVDMLEFLK